MADTTLSGESLRTDAVFQYLDQVEGARCVACGAAVCGHEAVICLAMGFKTSPRCLSCLAAGLARDRHELRDHLYAYVDHHECFRAGWDRASGREGFDPAGRPACLWTAGEEMRHVPGDSHNDDSGTEALQRPTADGEWDAGEMGCGELVLDLRLRLQTMKPGQVLRLTARDPGAPEDLPAWCRLTGHTLLSAKHPE